MRPIAGMMIVLVIGWGTVAWATDFDRDGKDDIAIFRPSSGLWAIRGVTKTHFGSSQDEPIPGDYNGDGIVDLAIFRSSSGLWAVRNVTRVYYGSAQDVPITAGGGSQVGRFIAGDVIIGISRGGVTDSTNYEKVAEFLVGQGGTLRIVFSLKSNAPSFPVVYGQIRRNGTQVGAERSTISPTPETFSEDISDWSPGDLLQLWMRCSAADYVEYRDFKLQVGPGPFCTYIPPALLQ